MIRKVKKAVICVMACGMLFSGAEVTPPVVATSVYPMIDLCRPSFWSISGGANAIFFANSIGTTLNTPHNLPPGTVVTNVSNPVNGRRRVTVQDTGIIGYVPSYRVILNINYCPVPTSN